MEGKCLGLILLFTVLHHVPIANAFGNYNITESTTQQVKISYDYCDFVLQISACMTSKECKAGRATQTFGIHGLWPSRKDGKVVTYCKSDAIFDGTKIKAPLRPALVSLWPSLYDDRYDDFWKREWNKHGTCFDDNGYPETAVVNYFNKAVSRAGDYNIWKYLSDAGIKVDVPTDVSVITDAIKKGLSVTTDVVQIQCLKLKKKWVVSQIFLCVNKKATALTECPVREMCSGKPLFPSSVNAGLESSIPMLARI